MKSKSFTLIELLVVIVIIGILAGVIMISTSSSISKAGLAKAQIFSENVKDGLLLNLISEFKFDDSSSPYKDSWGSSPNGSCTTCPSHKGTSLNECFSGGCLSFNGQYISFSNKPAIAGTISLWFKKESSNNNMIFIGSHPTTPVDVRCYVGLTSNKLGGGIGSHTWGTILGTTSVDSNYWHNAVITWNNSVEEIYLDSLLEYSGSRSGNIPVDTIFFVGAQNFEGTPDVYFYGLLDEIRIFDATLLSSQIKQNYIAGLNSLLSSGNISKKEYNKRINSLAYDKQE